MGKVLKQTMKKDSTYTSGCGTDKGCERCLKSVGYIGLVGNVFLVLLKVVVGIAFFSTALLADSLYSALDVGFSILIIVGLKISSKPPDATHDFGHGKIEFVITIILSVLTLKGAIVLFIFAIMELRDNALGAFSIYVLLAALISTGANYLFYKYTACVANKFDSPSIRTLSIHSKADAISSVLVVVSMMFAYWGYLRIGSFVAIVETVHIIIIGSEIFKRSLDGLLDASLSAKDRKDITDVLTSIPGLRNINYVRSRKVGHRVWVNVEIEVPSRFAVGKVDVIRGKIKEMMSGRIKNLEEVMVNVVPYREESEDSLPVSNVNSVAAQVE